MLKRREPFYPVYSRFYRSLFRELRDTHHGRGNVLSVQTQIKVKMHRFP